jgi:hypothetical protein
MPLRLAAGTAPKGPSARGMARGEAAELAQGALVRIGLARGPRCQWGRCCPQSEGKVQPQCFFEFAHQVCGEASNAMTHPDHID